MPRFSHLLKACLPVLALGLLAGTARADHVWINEFHYDNTGTDAGEFIEVVIRNPPGVVDLSTVGVTLYNGNGGAVYDTRTLDTFLVGDTIMSGSDSFTFYYFNYAVNGIQNGAPDGIALSVGGSLAQFLSYEGAFVGVGGVADGVLSTDIGVVEGSTTPLGSSLSLVGTGRAASDFTWAVTGTETPGSLNSGQTFQGASAVPEPSSIAMSAIGLIAFAGRSLRKRRTRAA